MNRDNYGRNSTTHHKLLKAFWKEQLETDSVVSNIDKAIYPEECLSNISLN